MTTTTFSDMNSDVPVSTEDKTVAVVSYLTFIGFFVAMVIHGTKKTQLGAFHLRQTLGLSITGIAMALVGMALTFIPHLDWLGSFAIWTGLSALWIIGLIAAASGQLKPLPVLGEKFAVWFGGMFN